MEEVVKYVVGALEASFGGSSLTSIATGTEVEASELDRGTVSIFLGPRGSIITIRIYAPIGLVTINLDYYLREGEAPLLTLQVGY